MDERFSPENIKKAYQKIGWQPMRSAWVDPFHKKCCPLTAIAIAEGLPEEQLNWYTTQPITNITRFLDKLGFLPSFYQGFFNGVDSDYVNGCVGGSPEFQKGFQAGVEVRKVLFPEIPEKLS